MLLKVLCCKGPGRREGARPVDDPSQTKVSDRGPGGVRVRVGQRAGRFLISHRTSECRFAFLTAFGISERNRATFHPCDPPARMCRAGMLAGPLVDVL